MGSASHCGRGPQTCTPPACVAALTRIVWSTGEVLVGGVRSGATVPVGSESSRMSGFRTVTVTPGVMARMDTRLMAAGLKPADGEPVDPGVKKMYSHRWPLPAAGIPKRWADGVAPIVISRPLSRPCAS